MKDNSLQVVAIEEIKPSLTNPRKRFDEKALKDLAESIKVHGVLSPIIIRPVTEENEGRELAADGKKADFFELIAGERRLRAAKQAGLKEIPALVRHLDNKQALEVQVIENLQRDDLHELEEAEGYEALINTHGYADVDEIAAKIGKSRSYVYARLKLCALIPAARKAFYDGTLNASTALLVARIPDQLQEKALKAITEPENQDGPLTYRSAVELIHDNFMLSLEAAPFDTKSANLVAGCGACTTCPKRSGNEKDLFPDVKRADVCTDPVCFKEKKEAAWLLDAAAHAQGGAKVLDTEKSEKLFYGDTLTNMKYIDLKAKCDDDPKKRTWKKLFDEAPSETFNSNLDSKDLVIARDGNGKVRQLMLRATAEKLLIESGHKFAAKAVEKRQEEATERGPRYGTPEYEAQQKKQQEEREFRAKVAKEVWIEAMPSVIAEIKKAPAQYLREYLLNAAHNVNVEEILERRKAKSVAAIVKSLETPDLIALLFEIAFGDYYSAYHGQWDSHFADIAKRAGVNLKTLVDKHTAQLAPPAKDAEKAPESEKEAIKPGSKKKYPLKSGKAARK